MAELLLPRDDQRVTVLGHTGYGKTQASLWQLSLRSWGEDTPKHQRKPWIIVDAKGDKLIRKLPAKQISVTGSPPTTPGLYVVRPLPHEGDAMAAFLWKVYEHEKIGLYFDEGYYITEHPAMRDPFRAILTRGRSKSIPCITCSQRPVWLDRFVFSESEYFQLFWLIDERDRKTIQSFMPFDTNERLPHYHSIWYDVTKDEVIRLAPVPDEQTILRAFKARAPNKRRAI